MSHRCANCDRETSVRTLRELDGLCLNCYNCDTCECDDAVGFLPGDFDGMPMVDDDYSPSRDDIYQSDFHFDQFPEFDE